MDNNRFIGFTLIMLLILTYYTFFPPGQNTSPEVSDKVVATESVDNNTVENIESIKENNIDERFNSNIQEESFVVENENIIITFSNKGAIISDVKLKGYTNPVNEKVNIYGESGNFDIVINDGKNSRFNEIIFDKKIQSNGENKIVTFTASDIDQKKITVIYEINDGFLIESKILLNDRFINPENLKFNWSSNLLHQENNITNEKNQTRINYFTKDDEFDYTSASS